MEQLLGCPSDIPAWKEAGALVYAIPARRAIRVGSFYGSTAGSAEGSAVLIHVG